MMHQYITCLSHLTFTHLTVEMSELCNGIYRSASLPSLRSVCIEKSNYIYLYIKESNTIYTQNPSGGLTSPEQQEVMAAFQNHQSHLAKTTP